MPKGKFAVVFGGLSLWVVEGETPLDARLEAANQLRNIGKAVDIVSSRLQKPVK
jgi:hypothetical protein